jgi:allantoicase
MQLLAPGTAKGMFDGWETARNPNRPKIFTYGPDGQLIMPGFERAVIQLGHSGRISRVIVETHHFKGNYPESCILEGCLVTAGHGDAPSDQETWVPLVPRTKLAANDSKTFEVSATSIVSHVRLTMYPDGGISRLRVFGSIVRG